MISRKRTESSDVSLPQTFFEYRVIGVRGDGRMYFGLYSAKNITHARRLALESFLDVARVECRGETAESPGRISPLMEIRDNL